MIALKDASILMLVVMCVGVSTDPVYQSSHDEGNITAYEDHVRLSLQSMEKRYEQALAVQTRLWWESAYANDANITAMYIAAVEIKNIVESTAQEMQQIAIDRLESRDLKRRIRKLSKLGYAALSNDEFFYITYSIAIMRSRFASMIFCHYDKPYKCDISLEPELTEIFANNRDPEVLKYYWVQWYNEVGRSAREPFMNYVELNRKAALLNNFTSGAEAWLSEYEDSTIEQQVDDIISQIRPLYEQLHAYVRYKLGQKYGDKVVSHTGPIPMHLLGDLWAQAWDHIADFTTPFPEKKLLDVTDEMIRQGYTPLKMFRKGDNFFVSINMTRLPQAFRENSILEKPTDNKNVILQKDYDDDEQAKINQYYRSALTKLVFLPFAYTLDKYRWGVFRGDIKPTEYNCKFWQLRSQYSGIEPPVVRTEEDFDAPAKYHVSADVEYLRYFVSYIIQFQFHRAACTLAGEYVKGDPEKTLNNCDIYQSTAAGNKLKEMLPLGSSNPWTDAMEILTGEWKMSADALLEYYDPLYNWLLEENKRLGVHVGWTDSEKCVANTAEGLSNSGDVSGDGN
ncbi:angiotensin-converting enzyme-like [Anopheles ziemanni]|uniref:angiotensin-converting enzyme-like n=1 Tax=Anopheles ziemanni TaxID=345580 RepID=UPI00265E2C96|nr:angiotensin-converting enzyme-like [Anopheles ziemanni]